MKTYRFTQVREIQNAAISHSGYADCILRHAGTPFYWSLRNPMQPSMSSQLYTQSINTQLKTVKSKRHILYDNALSHVAQGFVDVLPRNGGRPLNILHISQICHYVTSVKIKNTEGDPDSLYAKT